MKTETQSAPCQPAPRDLERTPAVETETHQELSERARGLPSGVEIETHPALSERVPAAETKPYQALSERARGLPPSPLRALLSSPQGPDSLDWAGGHPDPALFPAEALAHASERVLLRSGSAALQYAATEGFEPFRAWIAGRLTERGLATRTEDVLVTSGAQQALTAVTLALAGPGRPLLLERPAYPGAIQAAALAEAPLELLDVTATGWDLEAFARSSAPLAYVMPHHHNPTSRRATEEAQEELASLAERRGTFVLEDDAYGELDFYEPLTRPLVARLPERGLLIGSFSKVLSPGLRLGFVRAPAPLRPALVKILQALNLQASTFTQHLAHELLTTFDFEAHLAQLRRIYALRAQDLSDDCRAAGLLPAPVRGGLFLWVETRASARSVAERAARHGVLCVPESAFQAPGASPQLQELQGSRPQLQGSLPPLGDAHLRLSFSRYESSAASRARLREAFASD